MTNNPDGLSDARAANRDETMAAALRGEVFLDRYFHDNEAKAIYDTWQTNPEWVPWVERGNSHMQDRARREAASKHALAVSSATPPASTSTAIADKATNERLLKQLGEAVENDNETEFSFAKAALTRTDFRVFISALAERASSREQFLHAAKGTGRADTAWMPDGPYMSMQDAADVHATLAGAASVPRPADKQVKQARECLASVLDRLNDHRGAGSVRNGYSVTIDADDAVEAMLWFATEYRP